jgi:hypothetical protein
VDERFAEVEARHAARPQPELRQRAAIEIEPCPRGGNLRVARVRAELDGRVAGRRARQQQRRRRRHRHQHDREEQAPEDEPRHQSDEPFSEPPAPATARRSAFQRICGRIGDGSTPRSRMLWPP